MRSLGLIVVAAALLLRAAPALGDLVAGDLLTPGDGLVTLDTATGWEWLDVSATTGHTYNEVLGGVDGYTTTHGFRYATQSEVATLYQNAGVGDHTSTYVAENFEGATLILQLLSCTGSCGQDAPFLQGMADYDDFDELLTDSPFLQRRVSTETARAAFGLGRTKSTFSNSAVGSYLVRSAAQAQPVSALPAPGIAALTLLLLTVVLCAKPRRASVRAIWPRGR